MSAGAIAGGAAAARNAAQQALRASGAIVRVTPEVFVDIVNRHESPLVVKSEPSFFANATQYMTSYKGFCFHCKSTQLLTISSRAELIAVKKIWIPG